MECVNLIPAPRREAKTRRTHLRALTVGLAVYVSVMLAAYGVCYALSDGDTEATFREMRHIAAKARISGKEIRSLRAAIAETEKELTATRAVARHPDWSLLLTVLAGTVAEEIVLQRCVLNPVEGKESEPGDVEERPSSEGQEEADGRDALAERLKRSYRLEVGGFARTQAAVSHFVLRLEKIHLFDHVKLIKTNRQVFRNKQAVAFQLECSLDGRKRTASR